MPTVDQHLEKAEHNERFAVELELKTGPYLDRVVTGKFYAALHYIEAYPGLSNIHPPHHQARDSYVGRDANLSVIYQDYRKLKHDSEDARYRMRRFSTEEIRSRIDPALERIKTHLRTFIPQIRI